MAKGRLIPDRYRVAETQEDFDRALREDFLERGIGLPSTWRGEPNACLLYEVGPEKKVLAVFPPIFMAMKLDPKAYYRTVPDTGFPLWSYWPVFEYEIN